MYELGHAGLSEAADRSGLAVSEAIGAYLDKANGDIRLALAFSVADTIATTRLVTRGHVARPSLSPVRDHIRPDNRIG